MTRIGNARRTTVALSAALLTLLPAGQAFAHEAAPARPADGQQAAASEAPGTRVMMQRMMALMRDGNPGMQRIMALMGEGNPGMRVMMQRMMAAMSETEMRQMMEMRDDAS